MSKQAGLAVTDGIWLQYACPQAVSGGGKTFWGWVDTKGDICVASYNHSTQEIVKAIVSAAFDADDHSAPSLLIRSDGKIIVFYTEHLDNVLRWKISSNAYDISSFGSELTYTLATGGVLLTYPQPVELTGESKIYVFFRRTATAPDDREWRYVTSTDNGATFGSESILRENFQSSGGEYIINPYTMPVANGASRIDFVSFDYEQIGEGGLPAIYITGITRTGHITKAMERRLRMFRQGILKANLKLPQSMKLTIRIYGILQ